MMRSSFLDDVIYCAIVLVGVRSDRWCVDIRTSKFKEIEIFTYTSIYSSGSRDRIWYRFKYERRRRRERERQL